MTLNINELIHHINIRMKLWGSSKRTSFQSQPTDNARIKSSAESNEFREKGNELYKRKKFEKAKRAYTLCIAYALENSEELYKAYGNRSAVLFELREFASCLLDINRALQGHCSNLLRQKLLGRKKRCLARMKSSTKDEIDEDATNPPTDQEPSWRVDMLNQFGNPLLPNASPKIELNYNEKWGRHFVANADIETGEILMSEKYFLTVYFPLESCYTHCDFCIKECDALIPCPSCARAMYCSDRCRALAYDSYHRIECKLFLLGFCDSLNESFAIRMFLTGTEQGKTLKKLMHTLSFEDIFVESFDFSGKPAGSDYLTALRMAMQNDFNESLLISNIRRAIEVVIGLRKSSFFESLPHNCWEEVEMLSIALLLNNYSSNRYRISDSTGDRGQGQLVLGHFLNHSCFPNVSRYVLQRESILFAVRPILKGEQIFIAYGDDFIKSPKAKRTEQLDFICQCEACSEDWPSFFESDFFTEAVEGGSPFMLLQDRLIPHNEKERCTLLEIIDVVTPLINDTTLINLRIYELSRILAKTMSLLYKVMEPVSFPLVQLRCYFHKFLNLYFKERESDPAHNKNLKFPELGVGFCRIVELLSANLGAAKVTTDMLLSSKALSTMMDVIDRLRIYKSEGRFIKQKMIR